MKFLRFVDDDMKDHSVLLEEILRLDEDYLYLKNEESFDLADREYNKLVQKLTEAGLIL